MSKLQPLAVIILLLALTLCGACTTPPSLPVINQPSPPAVPVVTSTVSSAGGEEPTPLPEGERRRLFQSILTHMRSAPAEFVAHIDWKQLNEVYEPRIVEAATTAEVYAVLKEMVAEVQDPRARLYDPAEVAALSGPLGGIGANLQVVSDGVIFAALAPGGPADEAGLQPGDWVLVVDSTPVSGIAAEGIEGVLKRVRGEPGSQLVLTVQTADGERKIAFTRRIVDRPVPAFHTLILPNTRVGVLVLLNFSNVNQISAALEALSTEAPLEGLIIDLRLPTRGQVNEVTRALDLFAGAGRIGHMGDLSVQVPDRLSLPVVAQVPIVVLIGPDTNGSSEIFAAGMHLLARSTLLGMPTAGRAETEWGAMLTGGAYLSLPVSAFSYLDGTEIVGTGVVPDVEAAVEGWRYPTPEDPLIKAALALLQQSQ